MTAALRDAAVTAYVALGSNLDDPERQVRQAIIELAALPATAILGSSALYRTDPVGPPGQPDYINAVVQLDTRLHPEALLAQLQAVELRHGRRRDGTRWGPRTLDLDLILYGNEQVDAPGLTVPHRELPNRAFVLVPLSDVAPDDLDVPGMGILADLLAACPAEGVHRLQDD